MNNADVEKCESWEIWGIASGRGTTKGAAPGAFTVREYTTLQDARSSIANGDWRHIVSSGRK